MHADRALPYCIPFLCCRGLPDAACGQQRRDSLLFAFCLAEPSFSCWGLRGPAVATFSCLWCGRGPGFDGGQRLAVPGVAYPRPSTLRLEDGRNCPTLLCTGLQDRLRAPTARASRHSGAASKVCQRARMHLNSPACAPEARGARCCRCRASPSAPAAGGCRAVTPSTPRQTPPRAAAGAVDGPN